MHLLQTYLVEDSPLIRENLIATLEELAPVRVVGSAEGEHDARDWLAGHDVDLVIIDLFLKDGSGIGLLQGGPRGPPGARRVVLSNFATDAMRVRCLSLGADAVFDKSAQIDALIAYCHRLASAGPGPSARAR